MRSRFCAWRSSERIPSTVLLSRSISRLRSLLVKPNLRTACETRTMARARFRRARRWSLGLFFCETSAYFSSRTLAFLYSLAMSSILPVNSFRRFCRISSVISSSSKVTTSLIERTPFFRSSPMASSSRITIGDRDSALSTRICPRSMRLAISTSPSRVSRGTVPISRKYMRTGSLVFSRAPGVRSSSTSSEPSSTSSNFLSSAEEGILGPSSTSIPCVPIVVSRSSRSSGLCTSCGMRSLTWSYVRYPFSLPVSISFFISSYLYRRTCHQEPRGVLK